MRRQVERRAALGIVSGDIDDVGMQAPAGGQLDRLVHDGPRRHGHLHIDAFGFGMALENRKIEVDLLRLEGGLAVHLEAQHLAQVLFRGERQVQRLAQRPARGQPQHHVDFP